MRLAHEDIRVLCDKLIRVGFHWKWRIYLEANQRVEAHVVKSDSPDVALIEAMIRSPEQAIEIPPGVFIYVANAHDDPLSGMLLLHLWGRYKFWASVQRPTTP